MNQSYYEMTVSNFTKYYSDATLYPSADVAGRVLLNFGVPDPEIEVLAICPNFRGQWMIMRVTD